MREILFRGKDKITGEWVVSDGIYQNINPKSMITTVQLDSGCDGWVSVDPETVGQFTGLYDENSKRIYEGDIVLIEDYNTTVKGLISYITPATRFCVETGADIWDIDEYLSIKVIGNIHDNPELLEECDGSEQT